MKRNWEYWLRWIFMYPSAFVANILINIPLSLATNFSSNNGRYDPLSRDYNVIPQDIINSFLSALAFIFITFKIAPEFKKVTMVTTSILWVAFLCFFILTDQFKIVYSLNKDFKMIIPSILGVLFVNFYKLKSLA
jgi:hypothetical protein